MNATPVSGSTGIADGGAGDPAPAPCTRPCLQMLARSSLLALAVMASSACLVIAPPSYEEPQRTAPFLIASDAFPTLLKTIDVDELTQLVEFGGAVLSEDTGNPVHIALYIDYGQPNAAGLPYKNRVYPFEPIAPGTIADGPRKFQGKKWYLDSVSISPGCHTVTMIASHEFNASVCPVDVGDSSSLSWQVIRCDQGDGSCPTECPPLDCGEQCPSCETFAADAGADGGAP